MKKAILLAMTVILCGCEVTPTNPISKVEIATSEREASEMRGEKFARNRCSDCHAVEGLQTSPVPAAPTFASVVNTPNLNRETLTLWLNRSHDYPREMYFEIPAEHIEDLVAYMLTLRTDGYKPAIGSAPTPHQLAVREPLRN